CSRCARISLSSRFTWSPRSSLFPYTTLFRSWERLFIGEVKAGRDPSRLPKPSPKPAVHLEDVGAFLDAYWERCIKPAGLRSLGSVRSQISVLKQHFGTLPLSALEDADEINRFKSDSEW